MALGLILAAAVFVTTSGLVIGLIKLKESERERIKKLFEKETGEARTFDELRKAGLIGFTHCYLEAKLDIGNLKSSAALEIVLDLVKLDLVEGAKPEEIVFGCCQLWPQKEVIKAVIKETGARVGDILEYENKDGINCLMAMFDVLNTHREATGKDPAETEMVKKVEESAQYLIELGEKQGLDMKKILEKTSNSGQTLLFMATDYSQNLASKLIDKGVNAKSITFMFETPKFRFKSLQRFLISAGVNPFALDYTDETQADCWNVSHELISELNPDLTSEFYYSTTSLPCNDRSCDSTCKQGLPDPWYYNSGLIFDFAKKHWIGGGGEGAVFLGKFHGHEAAFKFVKVKVKNLRLMRQARDIIHDLTNQLLNLRKLSLSNGPNILPFYGHIRQQLSAETVKKLGLGSEITRFDVFIAKQCDYDLALVNSKIGLNIDDARIIIDQLICAQEQLQATGVCHNDIKPANIFVDDDNQNTYKVIIGDFGQLDRLGGTPGWTPPEFIDSRVPGVSDMYSFGLVFLYLLCENDELFYSFRENFIEDKDVNQQWFLDLMNNPVIKLVQKMTEPDHKDRITLPELKSEWTKMRQSVQLITLKMFLNGEDSVKNFQDIVGRNLTLSEADSTFTRTHLQGDTTLCWLYSFASSLHQSMKLKAGKV